MFWRFAAMTTNIDNLLSNDSVTLEDLMDEDDILTECKAQNAKLISFLCQKDTMEELVDLVTKEPAADVEDKFKYKYPNTACELLTSDVPSITEQFTQQPGVLDKLYDFLSADTPSLNPLLASFVSKVMSLLIVRNGQYILDYLKTKEDFMGCLLSHMETSAVMDLLVRLTTGIVEPHSTKLQALEWLDSQRAIERLVDLIHPSKPPDAHCNASQVLCDVIKNHRETTNLGSTEFLNSPVTEGGCLIAKLESESTISILLNNMLDKELNESVLTNGLQVLHTIASYRRPLPEGTDEQPNAHELAILKAAADKVLASVCPRLEGLANILSNPPQQRYSSMPTTCGLLQPPLGHTRLLIAHLLADAYASPQKDLATELIRVNPLRQLLDLFFKYRLNNFLHTQVQQSICSILLWKQYPSPLQPRRPSLEPERAPEEPPKDSSEDPAEPQETETSATSSGEEQSVHQQLIIHVFKDCSLLGRIIESWEDPENLDTANPKPRGGFMGHLTKIANHVTEFFDSLGEEERASIEGLVSESEMENWKNFVSTYLVKENKRNAVEEIESGDFSSDAEENSFKDIPYPEDANIQQAFAEYQGQPMTSNFVDQFGMTEENFLEQESKIDAAFENNISSINFSTDADEESTSFADFQKFDTEHRSRQSGVSDLDEDDEGAGDAVEWPERTLSQSSDKAKEGSKKASSGGDDEGAAPLAGGELEWEDSSSDEDLESPRTIQQAPVSPENMDTSGGEDMIVQWPPTSNASNWDDSNANWATSLTAATSAGDIDFNLAFDSLREEGSKPQQAPATDNTGIKEAYVAKDGADSESTSSGAAKAQREGQDEEMPYVNEGQSSSGLSKLEQESMAISPIPPVVDDDDDDDNEIVFEDEAMPPVDKVEPCAPEPASPHPETSKDSKSDPTPETTPPVETPPSTEAPPPVETPPPAEGAPEAFAAQPADTEGQKAPTDDEFGSFVSARATTQPDSDSPLKAESPTSQSPAADDVPSKDSSSVTEAASPVGEAAPEKSTSPAQADGSGGENSPKADLETPCKSSEEGEAVKPLANGPQPGTGDKRLSSSDSPASSENNGPI